MTINCYTADEFYDAIARLVRQGLQFRANAHDYSIVLNGGY
jgi:hypothetical protein